MKLLNLGCGSVRPQNPEWVNLDDWEGGGHEINEPNFVRHDIRNTLPFEDNTFDGCLFSHCLEHFDAQEGLRVMRDILRVLKPGGSLVVSVPNTSYFRLVYDEDRNANWPRLFGVSDPPNPIPTWFEAALWFDQHKAIMSEDTVWAYFMRAGFNQPDRLYSAPTDPVLNELYSKLNRLEFSLVMTATKP